MKLRLFTLDDLQIMFSLGSDPDVIKYADTPCRDLEEAKQRLEQGPLADYQKYGYGRFAVELKETGKVIGFFKTLRTRGVFSKSVTQSGGLRPEIFRTENPSRVGTMPDL